MWRLDVSSEAELEIFEVALRYQREREGLGLRLEAQVNSVSAKFQNVRENSSAAFPAGRGGVRRALPRERNHEGLDDRLISGSPLIRMTSRVRRHPQLGGLLNFYERAA